MADEEGRRPGAGNRERANRILDAAGKLLMRYGYDKTTVSDIAQEAGVSKGAIYLHFTSREALFSALIVREIWRYTDAWLQRMESDPEGGTVTRMLSHAMGIIREFPLLHALYSNNRHVLGELTQMMSPNLYIQAYHFRREFIQQMQAAGAVRKNLDPQVISYILTMIAYGFVKIDEVIPPEHAPPMDAVLDSFSELFGRALEPDEGSDSEAGKQIIKRLIENIRGQRPDNWFELLM